MSFRQNESIDDKRKGVSNQDQSRNSGYPGADKAKIKEATPKETLNKSVEISRRLMIEGQAQRAFELTFDALKEALPVFGENAPEILPAYFVLAETSIEESKLKKAEDFLIAAYWNLLKHNKSEKQLNDPKAKTEASSLSESDYNMYKGTLHRVFSKLYTAQGAYDRAIDEIKMCIYLESKRYGPEHIQLSLSYFDMGNIFAKTEKEIESFAFFQTCVNIWYCFFKKYFRGNIDIQIEPDDIIVKQGLSILKNIEIIYLNSVKEERNISDEGLLYLNYTLGLIYRFLGEEETSNEYCKSVELQIAQKYGPQHKKMIKFYDLFPFYTSDLKNAEGENE